ncbi:lysozyme inhibitor LprI family protein [Burkholderia metallica]|uniref:lysozyme inhibitor LprI family protein n=1 Tax=Burkholderia metallica TaxID=488729 RepID=UPI00158B4CD4|nr:lysozyme inhibitor LprI family protein [Burkholderia metallica]MCA8020047.1 lysozyme inhibitor LprI family protein [Burkholderia metallica]
MRHVARILAVAALASSHTAAFAVVDCEKHAQTMNDVRTCALDQNDQAVERAYQSLERKLKARNPDAAGELAKSQASWARFAGDTCNYVKAANPQQMIPEDARTSCWVDFSQARVRILKKWEAQLDAPQPAQQ